MSELDGLVHHALLAAIVRAGHAPTIDALALTLDVVPSEVEASLRRLHEAHGLVLHPGSVDVWLAHPFALSPTPVWVEGQSRGWWAPCLWCAMGIATLAAPTCRIHARLGGEAEAITFAVSDGAVDEPLLVHFALPPRLAWSNVVHWCATVQPFRDAAAVEAWCSRHALPRGELVPIAQVLELGRAWYGRHLDRNWRKWTVAEAAAIFTSVGLVGSFWELPATDERF